MSKKTILIFLLIIFVFSCAGCYNLQELDQKKQEVHQRIHDVFTNLKKVEIGMDEIEIRNDNLYSWQKQSIFSKEQICDVTEYKSEGYVSRSYYVGYIDYSGNCEWVASIDCVNGKVSSIFYF